VKHHDRGAETLLARATLDLQAAAHGNRNNAAYQALKTTMALRKAGRADEADVQKMLGLAEATGLPQAEVRALHRSAARKAKPLHGRPANRAVKSRRVPPPPTVDDNPEDEWAKATVKPPDTGDCGHRAPQRGCTSCELYLAGWVDDVAAGR